MFAPQPTYPLQCLGSTGRLYSTAFVLIEMIQGPAGWRAPGGGSDNNANATMVRTIPTPTPAKKILNDTFMTG